MPADPSATQSNFVQQYRDAVNELLDTRAKLKSLRELGASLGYPGTFGANAFAGANVDLVSADITNAFAAMDTLESGLTDFTTTPPTPKTALVELLKLRR